MAKIASKKDAAYRFRGDGMAYGCRDCIHYDEKIPNLGECDYLKEDVQPDYICNAFSNSGEEMKNDSFAVDALAKKYMNDHSGVSYRDAVHAVVREASSKEESQTKNYQRVYNSFLDKLSPTREEVTHFAGTLLSNLAELELGRKYTSQQYGAALKKYMNDCPALKYAYDGYWDSDIKKALIKFLDQHR